MRLASIALAIAMALAMAAPAHGRSLGDRIEEMPTEAWLASATFWGDAISTHAVIERGGVEANPLVRFGIGRRPGPERLAAMAAVKSVFLLAGTSIVQDRDPEAARRFARVAFVITGGVVVWNISVAL